jgi:hypothetical protein
MHNRHAPLLALLLSGAVAAGPAQDEFYSCEYRPRNCTSGSAEVQISGGKVQVIRYGHEGCKMRGIADDGCAMSADRNFSSDENLQWVDKPKSTAITDKLFFSTIKIVASKSTILLDFDDASSRLYCDAQSSLPKRVVMPLKPAGRCRVTYLAKWR